MNRIILLLPVLLAAGLACNFSPAQSAAETVEPALTDEPVLTEEPAITEEPAVTEEPAPPTEVPTELPSATIPPATDEPTATSPPPTETEEPLEWPLIKQGHVGAVVKTAQYLLSSSGYFLSIDGVFGPETKSEVMEFQSDNGLAADGIIGPMTWPVLVGTHTLSQGDMGRDVRGLQTILKARGYNEVAVDGIFGPITRNAVEDFQAENGLDSDGIVGPLTWKALISLPLNQIC